jgi:2-polyprenyl-3-methyl-5-hydroxy-6-metoxy-1,4-benzoquinol methylase
MHALIRQLISIGAIAEEHLQSYFPRVRDREEIAVFRDSQSEVIVLSDIDHVTNGYYEEREEKQGYSVHGQHVSTPRLEDNIRRAKDFGEYIRNKCWLDFGCGLGGMLDEMAGQAKQAIGLEPSRARADIVKAQGHDVALSMDEVEVESLDVVTMFHVLEHLTNPLAELEKIRGRLKTDGVLLIEVPHARDALFTLYESEDFKRFTFWSEHLVLHTRQSLTLLLKAAGFSKIEVMGYQRYPLANHLHWLARHRPGGHEVWGFLNSTGLQSEYEAALSRLDRTDTLVAVCSPVR